MKLPRWLRAGRRRRTPATDIVLRLDIDTTGFEQAMQSLAVAAGRMALAQRRLTDRVGHQLLLADVRREARLTVRAGIADAHPWLHMPPRHGRPSWHSTGRAVDVPRVARVGGSGS